MWKYADWPSRIGYLFLQGTYLFAGYISISRALFGDISVVEAMVILAFLPVFTLLAFFIFTWPYYRSVMHGSLGVVFWSDIVLSFLIVPYIGLWWFFRAPKRFLELLSMWRESALVKAFKAVEEGKHVGLVLAIGELADLPKSHKDWVDILTISHVLYGKLSEIETESKRRVSDVDGHLERLTRVAPGIENDDARSLLELLKPILLEEKTIADTALAEIRSALDVLRKAEANASHSFRQFRDYLHDHDSVYSALVRFFRSGVTVSNLLPRTDIRGFFLFQVDLLLEALEGFEEKGVMFE
jgi:hypothetical protein